MSALSCLIPAENASLAERLYCAYNSGGDPETAGRNFQGMPCPLWGDLPENVRVKWTAVAVYIETKALKCEWGGENE